MGWVKIGLSSFVALMRDETGKCHYQVKFRDCPAILHQSRKPCRPLDLMTDTARGCLSQWEVEMLRWIFWSFSRGGISYQCRPLVLMTDTAFTNGKLGYSVADCMYLTFEPFPFLVALQSYSEQEKATKWQIIINCFSLSADKWPFSSAWNFSEKPTLFKPAGITVPVVAKLYLTIQLRPQFSENGRFTLKRLG